MSEQKCPACGKSALESEYNFEYHKKYGRLGKCPSCNSKITRSVQAKGLVRTKSGQLVRSAGRVKKRKFGDHSRRDK